MVLGEFLGEPVFFLLDGFSKAVFGWFWEGNLSQLLRATSFF